jgi:hypothetical protein
MIGADILWCGLFIEFGDRRTPFGAIKGDAGQYSSVLHLWCSCWCDKLLDLYDYKEANYRKLHPRKKDYA